MLTVFSNCQNANCYSAFVATTSSDYGLYFTENLCHDDDSDPFWTFVGYTNEGHTLGISQFAVCQPNPASFQVCINRNGKGYIRYGTYDGVWIKILDADIARAALDAAGYASTNPAGNPLSIKLGWIDCWPTQTVYCVIRSGGRNTGGSGQYFLKSIDGGTTWYVTEKLYSSSFDCLNAGALAIYPTQRDTQSAGSVIFATTHEATYNLARFVFSIDYGETWYPRSPITGELDPYNAFGGTTGIQRAMPSPKILGRCYGGKYYGVGSRGWWKCYAITNWCTGTLDKDVLNQHTGWQKGWPVHLNYPSEWGTNWRGDVYVGEGPDIWYTHNLETGGQTRWTQARNVTSQPRHTPRINAIHGVLEGIPELNDPSRLIIGTSRTFSGGHTVFSTADDFQNVYQKGGANTNSAALDSGSVHRNLKGSANGVFHWKSSDIIIPPPPPPPPPPPGVSGEVTSSGWPIWINCQARELRADPSWDRLYVMSETVWPKGSGLWNQPILFQFVLSGYVGASILENEGRLAFIPTFAQGQNSMYSGHINYTGLIEAHIEAPLTHGVVVVGKFAVDDQVRYTDDITLATGALLGQWNLVGEFGSHRVTSIDSEIVIKRDVLITYNDALSEPTDIAPTPWDWDSLNDLPFNVNCQYRDSYLWVGAEKTGTAQPIRRTLLVSGSAWEERGGGLPEVPITDIDGGA